MMDTISIESIGKALALLLSRHTNIEHWMVAFTDNGGIYIGSKNNAELIYYDPDRVKSVLAHIEAQADQSDIA